MKTYIQIFRNMNESKMTREEFFEWLDTCPTDRWEITHEEYGHVVVSFPNDENDDQEEEL